MALMASDSKKYHFTGELDAKGAYQLSEGNPGITLELCDEKGEAEPEGAMSFWETVTDDSTPFATLAMRDLGERKDFLRMLRWIRLVGRDIMVIAETGDSSLARCASVAPQMSRVSSSWGGGRGETAMEVLKTAETAVARYINTKNVWDYILISLEHIQKGGRHESDRRRSF